MTVAMEVELKTNWRLILFTLSSIHLCFLFRPTPNLTDWQIEHKSGLWSLSLIENKTSVSVNLRTPVCVPLSCIIH
jgi:hypothetical protein